MKITKKQLQGIIAESISKVIREGVGEYDFTNDDEIVSAAMEFEPPTKKPQEITISAYWIRSNKPYFRETFNNKESAFNAYEKLCRKSLESTINSLLYRDTVNDFITAPEIRVKKDTLYGVENLVAGNTDDPYRFIHSLDFNKRYEHKPYRETADEITRDLRKTFEYALTDL